jgi:hypothetical protein
MSKVGEYVICFRDDLTVILLNCFFHYCCIDCYIKVYDKPCPICRL